MGCGKLLRDRIVKMWWTTHVAHPNERRTNLSLTSHLQELKKKHQHLSDAVEAAHRSPAVDDLEIARLKKQKLYIKEEIGRLSAS